MLRDAGVGVYRFSLPWSRLDRAAPAAWDDYLHLLDDLHAAGIISMVTLTHYDMPLDVMEHGGWLVPETADRFGRVRRVGGASAG